MQKEQDFGVSLDRERCLMDFNRITLNNPEAGEEETQRQ